MQTVLYFRSDRSEAIVREGFTAADSFFARQSLTGGDFRHDVELFAEPPPPNAAGHWLLKVSFDGLQDFVKFQFERRDGRRAWLIPVDIANTGRRELVPGM